MTVTFSEIRNKLAPVPPQGRARDLAPRDRARRYQHGQGRDAGRARGEREADRPGLLDAIRGLPSPARSLGLHLEVDEPRVHWTEAYISPEPRVSSWVLSSASARSTARSKLAYYEQHQDPLTGDRSLLQPLLLVHARAHRQDVGRRRSARSPTTSAGTRRAGGPRREAGARQGDPGIAEEVDDRLAPLEGPRHRRRAHDARLVHLLPGQGLRPIGRAPADDPGGRAASARSTSILRWKGRTLSRGAACGCQSDPAGPEWDELAERIAEKRLNIPGLPEETARRWRDECVILEITSARSAADRRCASRRCRPCGGSGDAPAR